MLKLVHHHHSSTWSFSMLVWSLLPKFRSKVHQFTKKDRSSSSIHQFLSYKKKLGNFWIFSGLFRSRSDKFKANHKSSKRSRNVAGDDRAPSKAQKHRSSKRRDSVDDFRFCTKRKKSL